MPQCPLPLRILWVPGRKRLVALGALLAFAAAGRAEPPLHQLDHKAPVHCLAFSDDGKLLATGCQDGTVRLIDVATGKEVRSFNTNAPVAGIVFSHDGKVLALRQTGMTM